MKGKHVAITGPTAGIGRTTSLELARQGAQLTLLCRSAEKAELLAQEIIALGGPSPDIVIMDMASLDSVQAAAEALVAQGKALDVLLNNAGVINTSRKETVDGFEETLAVNHFAPFLLTGLLLPLLQQAEGARIVNVASDAHSFVKNMGLDDMQALQSYKTFREYGRSKLANILFTRRLSQQLSDQGITVNCLHPGAVSTSLGTQNNGLLGKLLPLLLKPFFRTPQQGAETSIYLCSSDAVAGVTGEYFVDCKVRKTKAWARDDAEAERLWQYTEGCLEYSFPV
ncbi:3-oxoacyl-[acyl-carrier-protein] reductase FabG [Halioglobus japonicus]|nr:3-oxoacyl-[acyl-carrier-protein] reductase FabG [Halioglobus japonicus]